VETPELLAGDGVADALAAGLALPEADGVADALACAAVR
jgi:hypothetical protein